MLKNKISAVLIFAILLFFKAPLPIFASYGDGNNDGKVDGQDFIIWLIHYGQNISGANNGDYDGNNKIEIGDYIVWINTYNTEPPPSPTISPTLIPTPTGTPSPPPSTSCFTQPGPVVTLNGIQEKRYDTRSNPLAANTKVDAREASWIAQWPVQNSFNYPVIIKGGANICFYGGTIQGNYPDKIGSDAHATWDYMHGTYAIITYSTHPQFENVRIHNYGDGIDIKYSPNNSDFVIKSVHFTYIRDDCVQNDWLYNGFIDDSLFDGCYTGFSARTWSGQDPFPQDSSNNIWTIQNSLIRLQPMWGVYKNRYRVPGHGGFFKWDSAGISPKLALHNNVFRADQGSSASLGLPSNKLHSCSNNTMVWLGEGEYPDPLPSTFGGKPCFTMTTDKSVWDNAVANWLASH